MAGPEPRVPYSPEVSVAPEVGMPNDYLNVKADPDAFGAGIGRVVQGLGQTVGRIGDQQSKIALKEQGELNESNAINGETQFNEQLGAIQGEFQSKKGLDAEAALPGVVDQIKQLRQNLRTTMRSSDAARAFDTLVDRAEGFALRDANIHVKNQRNAYNKESAKGALQSAVDQAGGMFDNEQFNYNLGKIESEAARVAETEYGSGNKDITDNITRNAVGNAWYNRLEGIGLNDPVKAKDLLEQNKNRIPADAYTKIASKLAGPYQNVKTRGFADDVIAESDKDYNVELSSPGDGSLLKAFKDQEGPGNGIQPETWKQYATTDEKPGVDDDAVTQRLLDKYSKDYNNDTARVAVAYFSGPGNVSPAGSATPYINNRSDKNGKTTASYVDDILRRTQGQQFGAAPYQTLGDFAKLNRDKYAQKAYDKSIDEFPDRPDLAYQSYQRTMQHFNGVISREDQKDWLAVRGVHEYITGKTRSGTPVTSQYELDDAPPEIQRGWSLMQQKYPDQARNFINGWVNANQRGKAPTYGSGFWQDFQDVVSGKITTPLGLVPDGDKRTNTGAIVLKDLMDQQGDPAGKAFSTTMMDFFKRSHDIIVTELPGQKNPYGEERFLRFMQEKIPEIYSKRKTAGTNLFNPESKDYIGSDIQQYNRDPDKQITDIMNAAQGLLAQPNQTSNQDTRIDQPATIKTILDLGDRVQGRAAITESVKKGLLSPEKALELAQTKGWTNQRSVPKVTQ